MSKIALSSRHTKMAETVLGLHLTQREAGFLDQKPELAGPRKKQRPSTQRIIASAKEKTAL